MHPEVQFFGIVVPTYFVYISLLFCGLLFYVVRRSRNLDVNLDKALNLSLIIMLSGLFGSRAFHVFYEQPELYRGNWKLFFYFWQGGFVWYGGVFAAVFSGAIYLKTATNDSVATWLDFFAPIMALGYGLGRVACYLAGCCYGKYPIQLYAAGWELCVWILLIFIEKQRKFQVPGKLFCFYLCLHAIGRIFMEFFRDDFRGPQILSFSVSTWISVVLFVAGFSFLLVKTGTPITVFDDS